MRILIVDDEKNIRELLQLYVKRGTQDFATIETANNVEEAYDKILSFKPNIVFLDIQLETLTGFDLLDRLLHIDFHLIFVTAYSDYAIQAFEYAALHYLVKPVSENQVKQALNRCKQSIPLNKIQVEDAKKLFIKTSESKYILDKTDVAYFEADGAYCKVHLMNGEKIMTSKNLGEYEKLVGDDDFYRVHHATLVNISFVAKLDNKNNIILLKNGTALPISRRKKKGFKIMFENRN